MSVPFVGVGVAPRVTGASQVALARIRVTFNEPMADNDAIADPETYTLTEHGGAIARTVESVSVVASTYVELDLSGELTVGEDTYTITVDTTVTDAVGNALDEDHDEATFSTTFIGSLTVNAYVMTSGGTTVPIVASIPDGTYRVHVGPLGTSSDPVCYSGVSGQADAVIATGGEISVVVPPLPVGGPYAFTLIKLSGGGPSTVETDEILHVVPHDFRSGTLALRRLLPRRWRTGYRYPEQRGYPQ